MKRDQAQQFLEQHLAELLQARQYLDYSFRQVAALPATLESANDYAGAKAAEIFAYCREQKPLLDAICDRVAEHARQLVSGK